MDLDRSLDATACEVVEMDRSRCIAELMSFGRIPLDFSLDYLQSLPVEQLRHILMAAVLTVTIRRSA